MRIINRLRNSYKTRGMKEVVRKITFHTIYSINNKITERNVKKSALGFGLNSNSREKKLIVSLTSFPARFNGLPLCLKSLLIQTVKPDRIIVYLGNDTREEHITDEMKSLEEFGIEYRIDKTCNLLAHKKYFYAMQEFPNDIIITADDDLYYPSNWIETMYEQYCKYPDAIIARRVHLIRFDKQGKIIPYNNWIDQCRSVKEPSMLLIGTGGSGKLYPPHLLKTELFDKSTFMSICPEADDIWIKCIEVLSKIKIVWTPNYEVDLRSIKASKVGRLSEKNVGMNRNDEQLKATLKHFNLGVKDFYCQ